MTLASFDPQSRDLLSKVSTATLATALFKLGFRNVFLQDVRLLNPNAPRMVGEAYTLRYIPAREDLDHIGVFEDRSHPQRKAVEEIPPGHVMVIDSRKDRRAASAGNILITRMKMRGAAGVVTDGGFRDCPDIAKLDFPVYCVAPSAPTNLIHHHAVDVNVPIACADVAVYPGDIIVGDAEGVVVIPASMAQRIANEAYEMTQYDTFAAEEVERGRSIVGLYPATDASRAEFERWRQLREGGRCAAL